MLTFTQSDLTANLYTRDFTRYYATSNDELVLTVDSDDENWIDDFQAKATAEGFEPHRLLYLDTATSTFERAGIC